MTGLIANQRSPAPPLPLLPLLPPALASLHRYSVLPCRVHFTVVEHAMFVTAVALSQQYLLYPCVVPADPVMTASLMHRPLTLLLVSVCCWLTGCRTAPCGQAKAISTACQSSRGCRGSDSIRTIS